MSGLGKRFVEAGYQSPKPLIEVDGKPIIQHVLELFPGIKNVLFICNKTHLHNTNMREVLNRLSPNCKIVEIDYEGKGPVSAVLRASEYINDEEEIIVSYCDYGTVWNFESFLDDIKKTNADGSIACYKGFHPHMLGSDKYAFCKENDKFLIEIKEKESFTENKMNEYASNGTYYFKSGKIVKKYFTKLVDLNIHLNNEFYVSLVYNLLIKDKLKVRIFEIEKMLQWGTPGDLETYRYWSDYFNNIKTPLEVSNNSKDVVTILPMAGKGSRFSEVGIKEPKPMINVDDEPMVVKAVKCLPQSEKNVFICLENHLSSYSLEQTLKENFKNVKIVPIGNTTDGQATTCEIGIKNAGIEDETPILISACDNGVYYNYKEYDKLVNDENVDVIVWSFRNNQTTKNNPNMYSYLNVDLNRNIKEVSVKKLNYGSPLETHAIIGTMFFRKAKYFLDGYYENKRKNLRTNNEFYVDDVINRSIEKGLNVKVFEVKNYICWGTPDDYYTYNYWKEHFTK